jgi:hypothetical protein
MTLATILAFARAQVQTDSNGLTDANGIIYANEALQDFHRRLVAGGVDASQTQEAYTDATANQGTYLYPSDMLFLKAIECNFTDTNANNYWPAQQVDVSNLSYNNSFSWLRGNQSPIMPLFDDRGDQFEVFPTPVGGFNLSQAIRIFYYLEPTQYTSTSDTVAYPENLDTTILGWRIAADYLYSLGTSRIPDGDKFNAKYDERVKQYISTLSRGIQTPMQATPIQNTGWNY